MNFVSLLNLLLIIFIFLVHFYPLFFENRFSTNVTHRKHNLYPLFKITDLQLSLYNTIQLSYLTDFQTERYRVLQVVC